MYDVLCIGDFAVDYYYRLSKIPVIDEKVYLSYLKTKPGGTTFNTAYALKQLGRKILFTTILGKDFNGNFAKQHLEKIKLPTNIIYPKSFKTFHTMVLLTEQGEKTILLFNSEIMPSEIRRTFRKIEKMEVKVVFSTLTIPICSYIEQFNVPIVISLEKPTLDRYPGIFNWVREHAHTLILDKISFKSVFGIEANLESLKKALKQNSLLAENLVVTLGKKGSIAYSKSNKDFYQCPASVVEIADTTGAGDVFAAAFIHSFYFNEMSLFQTLKYSNCIASLSCEEVGIDCVGSINRKVECCFLKWD